MSAAASTGASTRVVLGPNQYGKAEVRLVKITRETDRHQIQDLNVTSQLHGDFEQAHVAGDNAHVVATDTQKNTVYALARDGVGTPEEFLLRLGRYFTGRFDWITGGRWSAEQYFWDRINDHDHAFSRNKSEVRTAVVGISETGATVVAGLQGLTVLKSTGSEFHGFPRDRYTTLQETTDRILATDVTARWRYRSTEVDFDAVYANVRSLLLKGFAETHSLALQQTMFQMGRLVLEAQPEIEEIRMSLPNKHHFAVDLQPFGLDNPNEVFFAADRPYGLIEAAIQREGSPANHKIWATMPGFC
ncbi:factor-independent urate hydroxylase [Arthrobacter sulfonylureivorans]|uniref:Uricase n=1 Tax=Arthrobacter sulfonylureivorans TaxID=2486855 RepID=A0ABY3W737_9MICC|nr:urate oxidase [Arthrobacter sulfonylureivorans]UNK46108.1 urate oxidase [Arthrobacter sulfonylureivorans]